MTVIEEIAAERRRQVEVEGYTTERDDEFMLGELAMAAAAYASYTGEPQKIDISVQLGFGAELTVGSVRVCDLVWPWNGVTWKPTPSRRRTLIKAAALLVAEIERLDRADGVKSADAPP